MPNFFYTAKSLDGKIKTGTYEAEDLRELAQILKEEGLILTKADSKEKKTRNVLRFFSLGKVSLSEKIIMTRNLWIMVATGLPLTKAFSVLAAQSKSRGMKRALSDVGREISKGKPLSNSFKKHSNIFSELYQTMIQVGEESGTLEEVLNILSVQLEKEKEMSSKIQRALIYPVILLSVMIIIGILLAIFVFPKINSFFMSMNAKLPVTTKIILGSGDFFLNYWHFIIATLFFLILIFLPLLKTKPGRIIIDSLSFKIPFASSLVKKSNTAFLIRSLSSLLSSGVPLIRSLEITSGTVNNFYFKQALHAASEGVEKGKKLFVSLEPYKNIFPYGALEMIEIGEETGRTSLILKKLAEFYEQDVSNLTKNLSAIIEPLLIVVIGAAVGIFAVSIIGPLYSVLGTI